MLLPIAWDFYESSENAHRRRNGDRRIAQRMYEYRKYAQAFSACSADVILVQHFEHGRTGHAGDQSDVYQRQIHAWQHQASEPGPNTF